MYSTLRLRAIDPFRTRKTLAALPPIQETELSYLQQKDAVLVFETLLEELALDFKTLLAAQFKNFM